VTPCNWLEGPGFDLGMDEERLLSYHRFTREHGVNRPLYFLARLILVPFFLVYFRLSRIGREHGKVKGR